MYVEWFSRYRVHDSDIPLYTYLTKLYPGLPPDLIRYILVFTGSGVLRRVNIDKYTLRRQECLVHNVTTLQNLCPVPSCISDIHIHHHKSQQYQLVRQVATLATRHLMYIPESKTYIERNGHIHTNRPPIPSISWKGLLVKGDRWADLNNIDLVLCPLDRVQYWLNTFTSRARCVDQMDQIGRDGQYTYIVPLTPVTFEKVKTKESLTVLMDKVPITGRVKQDLSYSGCQVEDRYISVDTYEYFPPASWFVIVLDPFRSIISYFIGLLLIQSVPRTSFTRERQVLSYLETISNNNGLILEGSSRVDILNPTRK